MATINTSKLRFDSEDGNTYIFDKNIGAVAVGQEVYSEDEIIVGKWINGKPIYSKTFSGTVNETSSSGSKSFVSIADIPVDEVVKIEAVAIYDENEKLPLPYPAPGGQCCDVHVKYPNMMYFNNISWMVGKKFIATMFYTKTTDAPNSYKQPTTELAEEHLTGETLNGKPVYEKCLFTTTGSSAGSTNLDMSGNNVDEVIDFYGNMIRPDGIMWPINYKDSSDHLLVWYRRDSKAVVFSWTAAFKNASCKIFVKYTKTTD